MQKLEELHKDDGGIIFVELFAGLGGRLAIASEAPLSIQNYTYEGDNATVSTATKSDLHQLRMIYPKEVPASTIQGSMSHLPVDIALIGQGDLERLGSVDLVRIGSLAKSIPGLGEGKAFKTHDPRYFGNSYGY